MKKKDEFNIIVTGVGGQGLITLLKILAEAALIEGYDIRTSELHGLSQREGSIRAHIRFGKKVFSPLIETGKADLILGLEISEALRTVNFLNKKTILLINKKFISYWDGPLEKEVLKKIKGLPVKFYFVEASRVCQKQIGLEILAGIFLLGFGVSRGLIPLRPTSILEAIKKIIPQKFLKENKKAFTLGQEYEQ